MPLTTRDAAPEETIMMTKKVLTTWAVAAVAGVMVVTSALGLGLIGGDRSGAQTPPPIAATSRSAAPTPTPDKTTTSATAMSLEKLFLTEDDVASPDNPVKRALYVEKDKADQGVKADDSYNLCLDGYGLSTWLDRYRSRQGQQSAPEPELRFAVYTGGKDVTAAQTILRGKPGETDLARELYENAFRINTACSTESSGYRTNKPRDLSAGAWTGTWFKVYEGDTQTASMRVATVRAGANVSTLYFAGDAKDTTTDALLIQAGNRLVE
ncbi:MAG: hypothetical protein L0G99_05510 [Propionibacteriales bacterium]|nr:hypothetical protein [Propionibacteriales bacterium]